MLLLSLVLFGGCSEESYTSISENESFIASMNIIQPSLKFFNADGQELANWHFEKGYSGAALMAEDKVALYGNQLTAIDIYQLSTGKKVHTIDTPIGTTNGYFDEISQQLFISNSKSNKLTVYNTEGLLVGEVQTRNYPMSMYSFNERLYVVNYKDTLLSVIDIPTLTVVDEWVIPSSSSGIWIDRQSEQLWLGGHGEGAVANEFVYIYDLHSGKKIGQLSTPLMPVEIIANEDQQVVISHGNSMLYMIKDKQIQHQLKIGANPFTAAFFEEKLLVAGYDDATIYEIQDRTVVSEWPTDKGPFQLLVRETQ